MESLSGFTWNRCPECSGICTAWRKHLKITQKEDFPQISIVRKVLNDKALYFGPKAPEGKEANWTETVPGKGWFVLLRLYGPLQPWFDKTWQPSDFELID